MTVLYLGNDLIFQSKISAACQVVGRKMLAAGSAATAKSKAADPSDVEIIAIDLGTRGLDLASVVPELKAHFSDAKVVAFGPHVEHAALEMAVELGCDRVMTRGQFDRELIQIFAK